jgi:hypothetical protein
MGMLDGLPDSLTGGMPGGGAQAPALLAKKTA